MKYTIFLLLSAVLLVACDSTDLAEKTFTTRIYNYSDYDLFSVMYKDASAKFDINNVPHGGSVFARNSSKYNLDNGKKIYGNFSHCCIYWTTDTNKPIKVRIVWSVVFDVDSFDGKSSPHRSEREFKRGGPGNRWCEAIIDVMPARNSTKPDIVVLHFLPDGTIFGELANLKSGAPLSTLQVKQHSAPFPPGEFFKHEVENPFYGIPPTKHRE